MKIRRARYKWDPEKNRRNKAKHPIAFEEAILVFDGITVDQIDDRFDYGEERANSIGLLGAKVIMVTYVEKNDEERRIVSARAATREERRVYFLRGVSEHGPDWDYLASMTDEEAYQNALSDPNAQPTTPDFWKNARIVYPKGKHPITLRLDADILTWFRLEKGYQTEINAILRAYMMAHRGKRAARGERGLRRRARRRFVAVAE